MTVTTLFTDDTDVTDGHVSTNSIGPQTFTALVTHDGNAVADSPAHMAVAIIGEWPVTDRWENIARSIENYDTGGIDAGDSVTAITMSMYGKTKQNDAGDLSLNIYISNSASNTTIVAGDFNSFGTTAQSDGSIAQGSWSTSGYNDWVFNATGLSGFIKAGIYKCGTRDSIYDAPNNEPTWVGGAPQSNMTGWASQEAESDERRPRLVITHGVPFTPKVLVF